MANYVYPFIEANELLKLQVWQKGKTIPGNSPLEWRMDIYGSTIRYADHGNTNSAYGWEIDHIQAKANGGSDNLNNLQPLQWQNNRTKADS